MKLDERTGGDKQTQAHNLSPPQFKSKNILPERVLSVKLFVWLFEWNERMGEKKNAHRLSRMIMRHARANSAEVNARRTKKMGHGENSPLLLS